MAVAWGAAAVDATEGHVLSMSPDAGPAPFALGMGILAAALALPGIQCAHAETAPERGLVAYKHLDYEDSQPGWDRIDVEAHAVRMLLPVAGKWLLDGSVTRDVVSGASPSFHTSRLRAGAIEEERDGWDLLAAIEDRVAKRAWGSAVVPYDPRRDRSARDPRGVDRTVDDRVVKGPSRRELPAVMYGEPATDPA